MIGVFFRTFLFDFLKLIKSCPDFIFREVVIVLQLLDNGCALPFVSLVKFDIVDDQHYHHIQQERSINAEADYESSCSFIRKEHCFVRNLREHQGLKFDVCALSFGHVGDIIRRDTVLLHHNCFLKGTTLVEEFCRRSHHEL